MGSFPLRSIQSKFCTAVTPGSEGIGIGVVIRGAHGEFYVGLNKFSRGFCSIETVELKAGLEALRFTIDVGFRDIILEGDNVSVVNTFKTSNDGFVSGCAIVADINRVSQLC